MEKLESLKLTNKMEIDTSMAKIFNQFDDLKEQELEYIDKITENDFHWPSSFDFDYEIGPLRKRTKELNELHPMVPQTSNIRPDDIQRLKINLAKKIEENTEMFVQLEYLARGTDPRDVRDGHVKLMSQLVKCSPAIWNMSSNTLYFNKSTHLYNLAFVFASLYTVSKYATVIIIDDEKLRPLCRFFSDLCCDVGLEPIVLIYSTPEDAERLVTFANTKTNIKVYNALANNTGCTGVVAERADLDSAIDCFINSSVTAPWRLKYIYVQESIFDDFKDALRAKCSAIDNTDVTISDKTFLIERQDGQGIPTNAFRTAKELISLIDTPYLSVWAAETALSHEIALLASSTTIWINDFGSFFGPPRSATSVFNLSTNASGHHDIKELQTLHTKWMKLSTEERLDRIIAAISDSKSYVLTDLMQDLEDSLLEVRDKTICFGVQQQLGLIQCQIQAFDDKKWLRILKILLKGNAIFCNKKSHVLLSKLQENGVPIACYDDNLKDNPYVLPPVNDEYPFVRLAVPLLLERLKVVRTNYGTIFAN